MKLTHINLVAKDAKALAAFYQRVFSCAYLRPPKVLRGKKVSSGNGLPNSEILSIWLKFPECDTPFLELHQHKVMLDRDSPQVNEPGFSHLSFQVADIHSTRAEAIAAGGSQLGEITDFGTPDKPHLIIYLRDTEGNILELEQPFSQDAN